MDCWHEILRQSQAQNLADIVGGDDARDIEQVCQADSQGRFADPAGAANEDDEGLVQVTPGAPDAVTLGVVAPMRLAQHVLNNGLEMFVVDVGVALLHEPAFDVLRQGVGRLRWQSGSLDRV